jgi:uncharacterized damage-inducible protein DinB
MSETVTPARWAEDYLERLSAHHKRIANTLDGLSLEIIDAKHPGMNSIGILVMHLTEAERYWVAGVACERDYTRDREAEFNSSGLNAAALRARLEEQHVFLAEAFASLDASQLDDIRITPRDPDGCTVRWALLHALEHTALHTGHIQILRKYYEAQL